MIFTVINDIPFQEMIEEACGREEVDCLFLTGEEPLFPALQEETPAVIFLDISLSSLDSSELIQKLKQNTSTRSIPIVAFGNQIRADLMQDAREMGADLVLPKSAFRQQLPELIRHYDKCHDS